MLLRKVKAVAYSDELVKTHLVSFSSLFWCLWPENPVLIKCNLFSFSCFQTGSSDKATLHDPPTKHQLTERLAGGHSGALSC